jgi:hypothetical protein
MHRIEKNSNLSTGLKAYGVNKNMLRSIDFVHSINISYPSLEAVVAITNEEHSTLQGSGLSYRVSGGLLAGVPGGRAGSLVHYALYEPGGIL